MTACSEEEVEFYDVTDCALDFSLTRMEYSYARNLEKGDVVLQVPVNVVGPAAPYDRVVNYMVLTDSCKNVTSSDYVLPQSCVVKAGELSTSIELTVKYSEELADSSKLLILKLLENEHFGIGLPTSSVTTIYWTDLLVRPHQTTVWRSWWYFFSQTYSRKFHEVVVDALGEEIENYCLWSIPAAVAAEFPQITRITNQSYWYAVNRKLREYVEAYDKAHPDAPLMHSDDAEHFSSYNKPIGGGTPNTGKTIASTLRIY
jgi:hypothetical protein